MQHNRKLSFTNLGYHAHMDDLTERLRSALQGIEDAYEERAEAVLAARAAGMTWRAIAMALGMTERGVIKVVERHNQGTTPETMPEHHP